MLFIIDVDRILNTPLGKHILPSQHLLVKSQHQKHQDKVKNLFKVNNRDTGIYATLTDIAHFFGVSIVYFEQGNTGWFAARKKDKFDQR